MDILEMVRSGMTDDEIATAFAKEMTAAHKTIEEEARVSEEEKNEARVYLVEAIGEYLYRVGIVSSPMNAKEANKLCETIKEIEQPIIDGLELIKQMDPNSTEEERFKALLSLFADGAGLDQ